MLEDDFLKERQNIREKMLKYSRAINEGKPLDEELKDEFSSDDILRRRFKNKKKPLFEALEDSKETQGSNIYLKEDLINVKLEEKQSFALKILSHLSKREKKKINKKTKKIFAFKKTKEKEAKIPEKENPESPLKKTTQNTEEKAKILDSKNSNKEKSTEKSTTESSSPPKDLKSTLKPQVFENKEPQKTSEDNEKEKNVLLEGFSVATKEDKNLNPSHLLFAILFVSFALFLFTPQVYIRNQIYYLSREIAALRAEESVLNEENKDLKRKLENMRFQNQILDYLE